VIESDVTARIEARHRIYAEESAADRCAPPDGRMIEEMASYSTKEPPVPYR
jgi:hypothetical protein